MVVLLSSVAYGIGYGLYGLSVGHPLFMRYLDWPISIGSEFGMVFGRIGSVSDRIGAVLNVLVGIYAIFGPWVGFGLIGRGNDPDV